MFGIRKIVSGGQTGVDRAALDWALENGLEIGGWCPAGRIAEDGCIDDRYSLRETPSASYSQRTEWNVRDSDGTVIFSIAHNLAGGSKLTAEFARRWNRPWMHISRNGPLQSAEELLGFIDNERIEILNVAGPRESTEKEAGIFAKEILASLLETRTEF